MYHTEIGAVREVKSLIYRSYLHVAYKVIEVGHAMKG